MEKIRIDLNIGPKDGKEEYLVSYTFHTEQHNEAFIVNAVKKAIKKLHIENEKLIVGVMDIFINNKKCYEIGLFGTKRIIKTEIRKVD